MGTWGRASTSWNLSCNAADIRARGFHRGWACDLSQAQSELARHSRLPRTGSRCPSWLCCFLRARQPPIHACATVARGCPSDPLAHQLDQIPVDADASAHPRPKAGTLAPLSGLLGVSQRREAHASRRRERESRVSGRRHAPHQMSRPRAAVASTRWPPQSGATEAALTVPHAQGALLLARLALHAAPSLHRPVFPAPPPVVG